MNLDVDTFTFRSTKVNPPDCIRKENETILNTCGIGLLTINGDTEKNPFNLTLVENDTGNDFLFFTITGTFNGLPLIILISVAVPDSDLTVEFCSSSPNTQANQQVTEALKSFETYEGKMITLINGQITEKEL